MKEITELLFAARDEEYGAFTAKLIPNIPPETVIGVRSPDLKRIAKEAAKMEDIGLFLAELPHKYLEENNLHGSIIANTRDYDRVIEMLDVFLPFVDNWATSDTINPKVFAKHKAELMPHIDRWLSSEHTYAVRFGISMLMAYYLEEDFRPEYLEKVAAVESEEYYINMMRAWYFATALAKQYEATLPLFEAKRLDKWTHNKAIQKAVESYRVSDEHKKYLKGLRIK